MTKHALLQRLIESNLDVDVTALEAVINQLWVLMDLPQDGEIIRVGGQLSGKWSVDKGQIKATVTLMALDENLLKINQLEGCSVSVFGVESFGSTEHPGQMKIEDMQPDEDEEPAA